MKSVTVNRCQQRITESWLIDNNKYFVFEIPNIIIISALRLLGRFAADHNHTEAVVYGLINTSSINKTNSMGNKLGLHI